MSGDRLTLAGVFLVIATIAGIRAENDRYTSNPPEQNNESNVEQLEQSDEHKVEPLKQNDEHKVELPKQNILTDKIAYKLAGQIAEFPRDSHKEKVGLAASDFDKDGDIDLAVMKVLGNRGKVFLYKNEGQGNYVLDGQIIDMSRDFFRRVIDLAAADFDKDGNIDLAFMVNYYGGYNGSLVWLYKNQGDGGCRSPYQDKGQGNYIGAGKIAEAIEYGLNEKGVGLAAADFDGDGDIELVARVRELVTKRSPYKYTVRLFEDIITKENYLLSGRQIEEATISSNSTGETGLAAADFDRDGDIDLAFIETSRNKHKVLLYTNERIETLVETQEGDNQNGENINN
ncbi:VCBS repeat-containing protein [Candidatus Woesearchaeota archaeon]|nr:VCBS repeat-containing protein [Candidatus Woesearchaeota archaeon]